MTYEHMGPDGLDYFPCRYGDCKLLFRGPKRKMTGNYVAFLGGTETYGKFLETPFPAMIETELGVDCVNFGVPNAGIDMYLQDSTLMDLTAHAKAKVVQVMGAQNLSNRFYSVHPRRNDRFLQPSDMMRTMFREADFTEFHFTRHMLEAMQQNWPNRYKLLRDELKEAWVGRMTGLLSRLGENTILLWFSDRSPEDPCPGTDGREPLLVDRAIIERLRNKVSQIVEVKASNAAVAVGAAGMHFNPLEAPAAAELLGAAAHEEATAALLGPLHDILN